MSQLDRESLLRAWLELTPRWRPLKRRRLQTSLSALETARRKAAAERLYVLAASHHQFASFAVRWAREKAGRRLSNVVRLTPIVHAIDGVRGVRVVELPGADRARGYADARAMALAHDCTIERVEL